MVRSLLWMRRRQVLAGRASGSRSNITVSSRISSLFRSGYLKRLQEIAYRNGALFIVDEAQTGFGRTGKWFAIEHHGVEPDILSLSKSVGNGFPVAAVVDRKSVVEERV